MTVDLTASHDACQPSADCEQNKDIIWLEPHSAKQPKRRRFCRKAFIRATSSLGLGACLTIGTATAATSPMQSLGMEGLGENPVEPFIKLPKPIRLNLSDVTTPEKMIQKQVASITPAQVSFSDGYDPLEAIEACEPAEVEDLQAQIILSGRKSPDGAKSVTVEAERQAFESIDWIQFDGRRVPRWIVDTILRASSETDVDPVYMMALADKESSFITNVQAGTSSAVGLFQFISRTWLDVVRDFGPLHGLKTEADAIKTVDGAPTIEDETMREHVLGLRKNPYLSALMAAEMMKRDRAQIERDLGRVITRSEFYFAHFFGVDSASKFMQLVDGKPKQSAPKVFPAAAKANKALFFVKAGKKTRQLTVAEVYDKIDDMIDSRLGRYEGVTTIATATADF